MLCGPNGIGFINTAARTYVSNFPSLSSVAPQTGGLAIVTHSGAVGSSLLSRAVDRGVGVSFVISSGNETGITLADYVEFLVQDETTRVIALYMEGVGDGRALRRALLAAADAGKPVVAYKVGSSEAGARAALSHTAKVAGTPALYAGLFRQTGVVQAKTLDELIEVPKLWLKRGFAGSPGTGARPLRNAAIVTISGGLGAIVADHMSAEGFDVPPLSAPTQENLSALPLAFGSVANPVDTTAAIHRSEALFSEVMQVVASDPQIDLLLVPNASRFPDAAMGTARRLAEIGERLDKPVVSVWYAGQDNAAAMRELDRCDNVANFETPEMAARALAAVRTLGQFHARAFRGDTVPKAMPVPRPAASLPMPGSLSEPAAKAILRQYGVSVVQEEVATTVQGACDAAVRIGFPIALKLVSPDVVHKARVGGVRLGLQTTVEVAAAFDAVMRGALSAQSNASIEGVLVSPMVHITAELLVGSYVDAAFGPVLVVGAGGSLVEQLQDVASCPLPASRNDCAAMLDSLSDARLKFAIAPHREKLLDVLLQIAAMASDLAPALVELDVNPLALTAEGAVFALDAVMRFENNAASAAMALALHG